MTEDIKEVMTDIPESYQRYLDKIYEISRNKRGGWVSNKELAEGLNIEPASVSGMLKKLKDNGYIKWEPRRSIRLTEKGKIVAMKLHEIHSLLKVFFENVLKIKDSKLVDAISCEIEHHITKDVKHSLKEFLASYLD